MKPARKHMLIRPTLVAIALAVPCAAALAESMDVVHRRDLNVSRELDREGGSTYVQSRDAAIASQHSQAAALYWDKTKDGAAFYWDKTKDGTATAWNRTKTFATQPPAIPPNEPQRYGRAGGFIGVEQFEVPQPGVTALSSAPANADAVKTGESQWGYTERASAAANNAAPNASRDTSTNDTDSQLR